MYGYFANKSKHRLIVKNIHKNMTIYLKNRSKNMIMINIKDELHPCILQLNYEYFFKKNLKHKLFFKRLVQF